MIGYTKVRTPNGRLIHLAFSDDKTRVLCRRVPRWHDFLEVDADAEVTCAECVFRNGRLR